MKLKRTIYNRFLLSVCVSKWLEGVANNFKVYAYIQKAVSCMAKQDTMSIRLMIFRITNGSPNVVSPTMSACLIGDWHKV